MISVPSVQMPEASFGEIEVQLSNGPVAIIDAKNWARVNPYRWHARLCKPAQLYAARTTSERANGIRHVRTIYLHRFIVNAPPGIQVHHKNRDPLDDREMNLEKLTPEEHRRCQMNGQVQA
jgi:hypothetical protein